VDGEVDNGGKWVSLRRKLRRNYRLYLGHLQLEHLIVQEAVRAQPVDLLLGLGGGLGHIKDVAVVGRILVIGLK
jgi:hypothetical protein